MGNYWKLALRRLLLKGILPALAGLLLFLPSFFWRARLTDYAENASQVEGQILSLKDALGDPTVEVRYFDHLGGSHITKFDVSSSVRASLETTKVVYVVFDRRNPTSARLADTVRLSQESLLATAAVALGILSLALGIGAFVRHALAVRSIAALFRTGQIVNTVVREHALRKGDRSGRFTFAYQGPDGRWYEGLSPELNADQLAAWPIGRDLRAVYDASNPRRSEADIFNVLRRD